MSKGNKKKWYVVWKGRNPGIYETWDECSDQVNGYKRSQHKAYSSEQEAKNAFKNSYYVVWRGHTPGIYIGWEECRKQVDGFENAKYHSYPTFDRAKQAFDKSVKDFEDDDQSDTESEQHIQSILNESPVAEREQVAITGTEPIFDSIAVDAACSGNPGPMEYRGVRINTGEQLFRQGPFSGGTNNIGEFLAIVHALAHFKRLNLNTASCSDSKIAIGWVKAKKCKTELSPNENNTRVFDLIARAEKWLDENVYENEIFKWNTEAWGENPADFGRK